MNRVALIGLLMLIAGCQRYPTPSGYFEALQLLELESTELQRAVNWHDYTRDAFTADAAYPFKGDNIRGIAPSTAEEGAAEIKKAADYLLKQRARVDRARKARDAADG